MSDSDYAPRWWSNLGSVAGVVGLLLLLYLTLYLTDPENAFSKRNLKDVFSRQGYYAVLTLGVAVLIITGGIDLSIGSVVGLSAVGFGLMLREGCHPYLALPIVLAGGVIIGLFHGLLVTQLQLQPFLVTLCGMFAYRGIARWLTETPVGLTDVTRIQPSFQSALETLRLFLIGKNATGYLEFPMQMVVALVLALLIGIVVHGSVYGRYWYAIGYNEQAARYAGIATKQQRLWVYVLCSFLASLGGLLLFLDRGTADPTNAGESQELYAITGAVLGGCSLRGGVGVVPGMVLGAMVLPLLENLVNFAQIKSAVIPLVIGLTLLVGTIADEQFQRSRRKT